VTPEDIAKWREWLGEEFSEAELAEFFKEHPEAAGNPETLRREFVEARANIPTSSVDFTSQVMDRLKAESPAAVIPLRRPAWRRWALAGSLAAAAVLSLVWYRSERAVFLFPGAEIRQAQGPSGEPLYFVRFAIERKDARNVALAGDFNQWIPVALTPSAEKKGLFTVELPLNSGIYSYAFVIDGKQWIADESADRLVDDGFGEKNSVIQL
jgi:hypothetical protein